LRYLVFINVLDCVITLVVSRNRGNMSEDIKKIGIPTTAIGMALLMIAPASLGAFAVGPIETTRSGGLHFVGEPNLTVDKTDGAILTVTGEVAGAGTGAGTATIDAGVTATVGCLTPKENNEPQGLQEASTTVTATATFEPTRQGRGTFTVSTEPITIEDFDFECPSANQHETLVGPITFADPVLTINAQTGTITATFETIDP
jgi:hypothetical protein